MTAPVDVLTAGLEADPERVVLGAVFAEPACLAELAPLLRPEEFREWPHQFLWHAMLRLWGDRAPLTVASVGEELRRTGGLADVKITSLHELSQTGGTAGDALWHARLVRDRATLRRLGHLGRRLASEAQSPDGPASGIIERFTRELLDMAADRSGAAVRPLADVLQGVIDGIDERTQRQSALGLPSGISALEQYTGGWHGGQLVVVAARPSVGKTAIAAAFALHAARRGAGVLFASLEQSAEELAERLLVADSGVSGTDVRAGHIDARAAEALSASSRQLSPLPLYISDAAGQSFLQIASAARRMAHRPGLGLLVVDYLQLVEPEDKRANRNEQVALISRQMKQLARELRVPLIALAQLNRQSEARSDGRPRLSDLRDSGQLEQDADIVILLHRTDKFRPELELIVAKQRNGPVGDVVVQFDRERMRFIEPEVF